MSITFPEGVIVSAGKITLDAYIAVLLAALLLGPLIVLHGYRAWWLDVFYAMIAAGYIGGSISRYRIGRRNRSADG
jgi:general stress protein CsbA